MRTGECVSPKHPDKMCDQISDAILDFCLKQDENSRVAVECLGGHGEMFISGEVTTKAEAPNGEIRKIVERIVGHELKLHINIQKQSPEIANGVDTGGAGDQGIMVGYACKENKAMIPNELYLSRLLCKFLFALYPFDGKTQFTIDDNGDILTIVASFQNVPGTELKEMIYKWIETNGIQCTPDVKVYANPAGDWKQGGFDADTGLTGRKLAVDAYGPQVPLGGGAFSGKDSTKVDRSGAYMARKIAVDMLRELPDAEEVIVKLAYAIGVAEPVMATAKIRYTDQKLVAIEIPKGRYNLTPKGIIDFLALRKPQFEETARFGHFGNNFAWDR